MQALRIGMLTACYKPVINGVTRMVSLYKQELSRVGHEVTVFTLGKAEEAGDEPGVLRSQGLPLGDTGYYLGFRYRDKMRRLVGQMDILHCHHLFMSLELAYRYGKSPIVYTNHTRYDLYTGAYTPLPQQAADGVMRQIWPELTDLCDLVIAPSKSIADVMRSFGVRTRIEIVPNGVDLAPFRQPPGEIDRDELGIPADAWPVLVYTGRLAEEKQLDELIPQFAVIREQYPGAHLILVGDGPARRALEWQVTRLGVRQWTHFMGAVPFEKVADFLHVADMYVTTSTSEVHPLTVIEAMAAGLPVVAVRSPGIEETVSSGETGLLVRHPLGLAAAIAFHGRDRRQWEKWGKNARNCSERFSIKGTVRRTLEIYDELLSSDANLRTGVRRRELFGSSSRLRDQIENLGRLLSSRERSRGPSA